MGDSKRLISHYRATTGLLLSRFGPITGFVLTLLGGFAALAIFTSITTALFRKLIGNTVTTLFDAPIVQYVAAHRVAELTSVMKAITTVGSDACLWIAVLIGGAVFVWSTRSWRPLIFLALAMLGAASVNHLIKHTVART